MAKPTKHANLICAILSAVVVLGVIIGMIAKSPMVVIVAVAPSVIYEVYRTEGESTRWASWSLLGVLILEAVFVLFGVDFDVAEFVGSSEETVAGYSVPLGDVRIVGPAFMGVCALVLLARTRGRYTKWLAVNILIGMFGLAYALDSAALQDLVRMGLD